MRRLLVAVWSTLRRGVLHQHVSAGLVVPRLYVQQRSLSRQVLSGTRYGYRDVFVGFGEGQ
jgi:hypothetical protein